MNRAIAMTIAGCLGLSAIALAQDAKPSPYLLGDAGGFRKNLADKGIAYDLFWTNIYQGGVSGDPRGLRFGGRLDLYLDFDGEKLASWKGGGIATKLEYRYGEMGRQGGAILPSSAGLLSPLGMDNQAVMTSLYLKQKLGNASVMLGRIQALDLLRNSPMMGGRGLDGFSHMEFVGPMSGVTPVVIFGAIGSVPTDWGALTFMAYDPNDQTNRGGFDGLFEDGVVVAASAGGKASLTRYGGSQSIGFKYSTAESADLSQIGEPGSLRGTKRGAWCASYTIEQFVTENWGFFGMLSIADGNPNIHQNSFQLGISGKGIVPDRPQDRYGLGYYSIGFSNALRDELLPLVDLRREEGLEAYYNLEVRPGLNITANVQWVRPADSERGDAILLGVRSVIRF